MKKLLLFDIDGTLLLTGGAGSRALNRTLLEFFGLADALGKVRPDGKTDPQIIREALAQAGLNGDSEKALPSDLFPRYTVLLQEELAASAGSLKVLPGVREVLEQLAADEGCLLGIATGNIEAGARLKLEYAGLGSRFSFGGFGSDAEHRTELIRIAMARGGRLVETTPIGATVVIGDTPRDVFHGREAGARTVAVASGRYSEQELEASGADLVLPSLLSREPLLQFLKTL